MGNICIQLLAENERNDGEFGFEKLIDAFHFVKLQRETFNWPLFKENE
jgi:hypothetical protein